LELHTRVEFIFSYSNGTLFVMYVKNHYYFNAKCNLSIADLKTKWES